MQPQPEHSVTQLLANWNKALPHIRAALKYCGDTHTPAHVWAMIRTGAASLYTSENSAVVTQVLDMPNGKQLHYWLAGGDLKELKQLEKTITANAKAQGIKKVSLIGRAGWVKELPGFNDAGRVLIKEIK